MKTPDFNIKRFGALMKWMGRTGNSRTLRLFTIIFVAVLLTEFMSMPVFNSSSYNSISMGVYTAAFNIALLVFAGNFMGNTSTNRHARLSMLMLPASNLEKFVARLLWSVGAGAVVMVAAVVAADTVRWLVCHTTGWCSSFGWGVPEFLSGLVPSISVGGALPFIPFFGVSSAANVVAPEVSNFNMAVFAVSNCLWAWVFTVFMLFGVAFRRMRVGLAAVSLFVLWWAVLIGSASLFACFFDSWEPNLGEMATVIYAMSAVLAVLAVVNVWLTYRLFCRLQIVNGKWMNL